METKLIEVRDHMTCLSAIAIRISGDDGYVARHAGYGSPLILFGRANGGKFSYDCFSWGDRTMHTAHKYVDEHFDELPNGAVLDVRFILGEATEPCESDEFYRGDT